MVKRPDQRIKEKVMASDYSITKYMSHLNKRGGPAFKNRYFVLFSAPQKVLADSGVDSTFLEELNLFADVASIPSKRIMTGDDNSISNSMRMPYSFTTEEMSFSFQLSRDLKIKTFFDTWLDLAVNVNTYEIAYKSEIVANSWEIWQMGKDNEKTRGTKLINVMPVQVSPVDFTNSASETQILVVNVMYDRSIKL